MQGTCNYIQTSQSVLGILSQNVNYRLKGGSSALNASTFVFSKYDCHEDRKCIRAASSHHSIKIFKTRKKILLYLVSRPQEPVRF